MSKRAVLWLSFAVVHVGVAMLGWALPNQPMGDVHLYYSWSLDALTGEGVVGVTEPFVYPPVALVPMVLAHGFAWAGGYLVAWMIVVTALDALVFAMLVAKGRSVGRVRAAWLWLAAIALLGPAGVYRIDAITVPIAIAALMWIAARPIVAAALLTVAMWIKVWPVALLTAGFIALRRRMQLLGSAVVTSAVIIAGVLAAGGAANLFGFVSAQTTRGLQLEAPVATFYVWATMLGVQSSQVYYDTDILTYQVRGPGVDGVAAVMTPVLVLAVLAVLGIGAVKAWRGASAVRLLVPHSLALVLTLIVFNKVGSPQFMTWLIPPIVAWMVLDRSRARGPATLTLIVLALTQLIYPLIYGDVIRALPAAVVVLTVRNILLIAFLVWMVAVIARIPTLMHRAAGATAGGDAQRVSRI